MAALAVAMPHFFIFAHIQIETFEAISVLGVEVFFVLSGFVLAPQILGFAVEKPSVQNLGIFLVRRWMRTVPAYLLALVILSITAHEFLSADFFRYAFYVQNLARQSNTNDYFSIAWSLSVEEWFYLAFPLTIFAIGTLRPSRHSALAGAVLFIGAITLTRTVIGDYAHWGPEVRRVVVFRVDSIAWGFLLYLALRLDGRLKSVSGLAIVAAFGLAAFAGFLVTVTIEHSGARWAEHVFPFVAAAIGALGITLAIKLRAAFEKSRTLTAIGLYLGRISYSVYLFHLLVLMTLFRRLSSLPWQAQLLAFIVATALIASLVYEAIEAPILRVRPKLKKI
jgi:peptidoglycan/LPS O-acetylase OafA/YrhL